MKVKIEVKSWNNYSPSPQPPPLDTHTSGGAAYLTYLAPKDNYSWMQNCSMGPLYTKNSYCLRKQTWLDNIKLYGFHCNPSGTVAGSFASRPKIDTCVLHILSLTFSLFHLFKENKLSVTGETKWSLNSKEKMARTIYPSPIMWKYAMWF